MEKFRCFGHWIDLIRFCVSTARFSVSINGALFRLFEATYGIRQGDSMSPFLFAIMAEALERKGEWKGIRVVGDCEPVTHAQFAEDTSLFGEASMKEVECIRDTLDKYARQSGQVMNRQKSTIFYFNTEKCLQRKIVNKLSFAIASLLTKYLGAPIIEGVCRSKHWEEVVEKCRNKATSWKHKWLSLTARMVMIKFVLFAIPIYAMSYFSTTHKIESKIRKHLK
ncbi:uncharacterized protein LOC131860313 [Cryptomeria japonica]|uniref:uncharacterized protein LOC131860313 n=1 Tax=Cryptomeria japonica TaxID=3369 RepID=UPI0027DA92E6|nr:uncharacterized protein LOC131860313 [Cryptomeria japonica]